MKPDKKYEAIVIGASTGGMMAIMDLLSGLEKGFKLPIIIVLHRQRNIKDHLTEIIQKKCNITIKEADEKESIVPGTAYLAPSNYHLLIEDDKTFSLTYSELVNFSRPSIDVLFESASEVYKDKLIGVILTGANFDGSHGLKMIKKNGGLTIVQNPVTAESDIMPKAAIAKTDPDYIMSLLEIADYLKSIQ